MIETLEGLSEADKLRAHIDAQDRVIAAQDTLIGEAILFLKPFAALAEVCDYFKRGPDISICSWKIADVRHTGPTARDCRNARDLVKTLKNTRSPK